MKRIITAVLVVLMTTGVAVAQHHRGPGGGGQQGGGDMSGGGGAIVGADGTIYLTRTTSDSATGTSSTQLVAISSAGATKWTITLANRGHLTLSDGNLLSVSDTSTNSAASSTITAISTATGATAWTLNVNGHVRGLEPFSGGTYAIVVTPPATQGAAATRALIAISNSGTILWTVNV